MFAKKGPARGCQGVLWGGTKGLPEAPGDELGKPLALHRPGAGRGMGAYAADHRPGPRTWRHVLARQRKIETAAKMLGVYAALNPGRATVVALHPAPAKRDEIPS